MKDRILKLINKGYHIAFCRIRASNRVRFCITNPCNGRNIRCDVPEQEVCDNAILKVLDNAKDKLGDPLGKVGVVHGLDGPATS